jgi:hypothetical protein
VRLTSARCARLTGGRCHGRKTAAEQRAALPIARYASYEAPNTGLAASQIKRSDVIPNAPCHSV